MDNASFSGALSACPFLLDLEIVVLSRHFELRQTLMSASMFCPLIERLFFESSKIERDDSLKSPTCVDLINNCPNLTSLALRGFELHDYKARILLKVEVARLLTAILSGDFKFLRHLDIPNREGLASEVDWYQRCYNSSLIPVRQVMQGRPDMCLLAEFQFPSEGRLIYSSGFIMVLVSILDFAIMDLDMDLNSEISLPSQLSSHTSDCSSLRVRWIAAIVTRVVAMRRIEILVGLFWRKAQMKLTFCLAR